jgi:glycosyltransferase involved in cell wall biosynthesis
MNYELFGRTSNACYFFENAVNSRFIGKPSTFPYRENNAKPRVGYVGWITERTDLNLLEYVARENPQWTLMIAGPQYKKNLEMKDLLKLKNVRYSEYIPHKDVPAFIRSLDVCLIPHRDTPYSRSMSPLKLFQYLASGRPIVSTDVTGLERFAAYLKIASDYAGFIKGIADTLENDTLEDSRKRISVALRETWDRRVREMFDLVKSRCVLISKSSR